ncbi:MAG TPA: hypothetical protein VE987_19900, partial [Polyangiaceae bacterium]|nr:hypothetical protein [Polyangiaceae bacterium]
MWRISDDVWDVWSSTTQFPQGVKNQIENAARWIGASGPGHWPDADMLPIGSLRPVAGWGEPRETRLTRDEQRTLVTFWCIVRSPLMMSDLSVWISRAESGPRSYVAVMNLADARQTVRRPWTDLGLPAELAVRDLW